VRLSKAAFLAKDKKHEQAVSIVNSNETLTRYRVDRLAVVVTGLVEAHNAGFWARLKWFLKGSGGKA